MIPDFHPGPPNHPPTRSKSLSLWKAGGNLASVKQTPSVQIPRFVDPSPRPSGRSTTPAVNNLPINHTTNQSSPSSQHPRDIPESVPPMKTTTRRTMSPVGSSYPHLHFIPSPSPSPFPTPPSLPHPHDHLYPHQLPSDFPSIHGHGIQRAYKLSDDIIVVTYNKSSTHINRTTPPANPLSQPRAASYHHRARPDGYVTNDSLPSLASDSS
jgi:hypothetical protein